MATQCHWCGKTSSGTGGIVHNDKTFCCEGCLLGYEADETLRHERDSTWPSLVVALAAALDAREHETGMHSQRVACHTQVLAKKITDSKHTLQQIYWGSLLHDIGKIAIPDDILLNKGALTHEEWEIMRSHPQRGYDIIKNVPFMNEAAEIILCHEERWDGSGYPQGLEKHGIPLGARLLAVIDTLDAMTSDRPYRKALPFDTAKTEIMSMSGQQFDPSAVEVFLEEERVLREMVEMKCTLTNDAIP